LAAPIIIIGMPMIILIILFVLLPADDADDDHPCCDRHVDASRRSTAADG